MILVVDASVALKWFVREEGSDHAAAILGHYVTGDHDAALRLARSRPWLTAACIALGLLDSVGLCSVAEWALIVALEGPR